MQRNHRNNPIPNLRKKSSHIEEVDLIFLDPRYLLLVTTIIVVVLLASAMLVAAAPNSNFPASI
jgi:hypothetical protein